MKSTTELFLLTLMQLLLVSAFIHTMDSGVGIYNRSTDPIYNAMIDIFDFTSNTTGTHLVYAGGHWHQVENWHLDFSDMGDWGKTLNQVLRVITMILFGIPIIVLYLIDLVVVACAVVFTIPFIGPVIGLYWVATLVAFGISSLPTTAKS
jgi:hypothetical protein